MAKHGNESSDLLMQFRSEKISGIIVKRFRDEYIVFDLLKILYDDTVDSNVKTELLINLEEYGHLSLTSESVDQVVTSLLDIVNQQGDNCSHWTYVCQALITGTSLIIQLDQLGTDICKQLVKTLLSIVNNINQSDNQRVRACACHCLIQLEEMQPSLLASHHDEFARLARQERTCVFQDYSLLAAKVLENIGNVSTTKVMSETNLEREQNSSKQMLLQKQISVDISDIRQFVAFVIENTGLLTRCGYFRIIQSVARVVKSSPEVSPMVFKPLMLHQMSTVSCVLFQTIMYLQREFQGEILTDKEQAEFLHRLCIMTDHPCLILLNKLLVSHWAKLYFLDDSPAGESYRHVMQRLRFRFYPSVFDPVDCQLGKLIMTSLCVNPDDDDGLEMSVLLGSLAYIHKLAWHTGSSKVAIVMFKALYYMYQSRNNASFANDIQRFLRGLCTDLPHFIPHTIDFLDSIRELHLNSTIYTETLDLLHKQVVMATEDQIEKSFSFYLQILKKAACEKDISQASSMQFLQNLAQKAQYMPDDCWSLGHSILEICRNFLLYQGTDRYYTEIGELLYYIMVHYTDVDVQDKARFYYSLLTGASDTKIQSVLKTMVYDASSVNQTITALLPGSGQGKRLSKITHLEDTIFSWERTLVSIQISKKQNQIQSIQVGTSSSECESVQQYQKYLNELEIFVEIHCRLKLTDQCKWAKVHALCIKVNTTQNSAQIPDNYVTVLSIGDCVDVVLKMKPYLPVPQTLHASVSFMCDSKETYDVSLPGINVDFCHLMVPLPWKSDSLSAPEFFHEMWKWLVPQTSSDHSGVESLKLFDMELSDFKMKYASKLGQYEIRDDKSGSKECFYAIFMPPKHHILLHCRDQTNKVVVAMVMDDWSLLPHVDKFLMDN